MAVIPENSTDQRFPSDVYGNRLERVSALARDSGLDGVLVTPGPDLRYLTGSRAESFERLTCLVVPSSGATPSVVLPKLELASLGGSATADLRLRVLDWVDGQDPYAIVVDALGGGRRVAVADAMPALHLVPLADAFGALPILATGVLRQLRMIKDDSEIEALRRAGAAIDRVHARMASILRVGRTEAEVGADIAAAILEEGHVGVDFTIVGSGPNGASPHHDVSARVVEAGDVVVVDIGGETATGYRSDCTRTYAVGQAPGADVAEWYGVLQQAQAAAVAAVRPGVPAEEIDAVARRVITDAGYGEHFIHRTGHGIGLDTHEAPYIVEGNDLPLVAGMAFSVEPGIYLPGRCGARIEDIAVCTAEGGERLNLTTRELVVVDL